MTSTCCGEMQPRWQARVCSVSTAQEMRAGSASKRREHRWRLSAADPARVRRGTPCPGWGVPWLPARRQLWPAQGLCLSARSCSSHVAAVCQEC